GPPRDSHRAPGLQDRDGNGAGREDRHRTQALRPAPGVTLMLPRRAAVLALLVLLATLATGEARAQAIQNATLRRANQAYDNLDYRQALSLGRAALRERLTGAERARAYEVLGFSYAALDSILKAVDAFKQVVLIEPERSLARKRGSHKGYGAFEVALRRVRLGRRLRVDSTSFVGGKGAFPVRFTAPRPARGVPRAMGAGGGGGGGQANF